MKVLKFGGKSLASSQTFDKVLHIIRNKAEKDQIAVVVSAIGDTTDTLEHLLELAQSRQEYLSEFEKFKARPHHQGVDMEEEFTLLSKLFEGVFLLRDYNQKIKDHVLAHGELISVKIITQQLAKNGFKTVAVDSRTIFTTDDNYGNALVDETVSKKQTQALFASFDKDTIAIVSGFIGAAKDGTTVTFGRNGSNYSAALLANFLEADELQNYTHVDGIFTANPDWVEGARKIDELSFDDANELANFGASILHAKTILPLVKNNIPLRILNTLNPEGSGTLISAKTTGKDIKSLSAEFDVALIKLEGRGLLGTIGIDARIFSAMANNNINVGVISQGSSERGIGYVVAQQDADRAIRALEEEFKHDFYSKDVDAISVQKDLAVISIVGQELYNFDKAYSALVKNNIIPILFNTTITGKNVSLLVRKEEAKKAINVLHNQVFEYCKTMNIAVFGHGLVGGTFIRQLLENEAVILKEKGVKLRIVAVANSKHLLLNAEGIGKNWAEELKKIKQPYQPEDLFSFVRSHHLENLIAVDNTASPDFIKNYQSLIENGFDLVSSNKVANTQSYAFYTELRAALKKHHKTYLYETNVGAGLPVIDPIKNLKLTGDKITQIKGVFSGSLSYIFNQFAGSDRPISEIIREARAKGYTEPDPREDLSGSDVGRKLLILAREIGLACDFEDIFIENLIPENLQQTDTHTFLERLDTMDAVFKAKKEKLPQNKVLKYVGSLLVHTQTGRPVLEARLTPVLADTGIGRLQGADNIFEIYTESYGETPVIIQGAGAGAAVTASGVFSDVLRLALA